MTPLVKRILQSRRNLCQLLVVAIFLSLGVNLVANWLGQHYSDSLWQVWLIGVLLILLGVLYLIRYLTQESSMTHEFEAGIFLDTKSKQHVEVDQYDFSEKFDQTVKALFVENEALKAAWESEHIFAGSAKQTPPKPSPETEEKPIDDTREKKQPEYFAIVRQVMDDMDEVINRKSILVEAAEFCLLEFLSLHLSEYFGHTDHDRNKIVTVERAHIPDILLENRALALLSTPIEDRQIFVSSGISKNPPQGEVHSIYSSDGAVYERFNLILPKGTKISRPHPGVLCLQHKCFAITMRCVFCGFSLNLPRYFEELYIGRDARTTDARKLDIEVRAQLKSWSFALIKGWTYFKWIDSFMEYLEEKASFDAFLRSIDWASVSTRIRTTLVLKDRKHEKAEAQPKDGQVSSGGALGAPPEDTVILIVRRTREKEEPCWRHPRLIMC